MRPSRHGWLPIALALLALPAWAAGQAGSGRAVASAAAAPATAAQVDAMSRGIRQHSDELARLHRQVSDQEAKSRAADARLREQDRAIETLRRQLRQAQPVQAPAKPPVPAE